MTVPVVVIFHQIDKSMRENNKEFRFKRERTLQVKITRLENAIRLA